MKRYICGVEFNMHEAPGGEWVLYRDANTKVSIIMDMYEKRIRELIQPGIKMPECNCMDHMSLIFGKSPISTSWFCPAHGYKRAVN